MGKPLTQQHMQPPGIFSVRRYHEQKHHQFRLPKFINQYRPFFVDLYGLTDEEST